MRFAFLSWDADTYQVSNVPLWSLGASTIDSALMVAGLYWVALCTGYAIGVRRKTAGLLVQFSQLDRTWDWNAGYAIAIIAGLCNLFYGAQHVQLPVPRSLITPLGMIGSLWPIPASMEWGGYHRAGAGDSKWTALGSGARRWLFMVPGLIMVLVQPYRERMLQFLLVPMLAAISAGKRVSLKWMLLLGMGIILLSTVVMSAYRQVLWEQKTWAESTEDLAPETWETGVQKAPWVDVINRLHGFDSLALTVAYVPEVFPFDRRNLLLDILVQLVPRVIYPEKPEWRRSAEFSIKIWGYGLPEDRLGTKIAPSMAGDLYASRGFLEVAMGGMLWGLVIGLFEGWKDRLPPMASTMVFSFLFLTFANTIERDIVLVIASTVQTVIVFLAMTALLIRGASMLRPR
jgi:hypothetical protein